MTAAPVLTTAGWHVSPAPTAQLTLAPDLRVWQNWADDWATALKMNGNSPLTIRGYLATMGKFATFAAGRGLTDPSQVGRRDVVAFVGWQADQLRPDGQPISRTYVAQQLRQLKVFYRWWCSEPEHVGLANPARDIPQPKPDPHLTPVLTDAELTALLATAGGADFAARRDSALIRMLLDTGMRRAELLALTVADVDVRQQVATVRKGKGGAERRTYFAENTAQALRRYLRTRASHPDADLPQLWLADATRRRGPLGVSGLAVMLKVRGRAAGIVGKVHAHRFRHTAFDAMEPHMSGGAAMELMGWKSRAMLDHYGRSNRGQRALDAARALGAGNRV